MEPGRAVRRPCRGRMDPAAVGCVAGARDRRGRGHLRPGRLRRARAGRTARASARGRRLAGRSARAQRPPWPGVGGSPPGLRHQQRDRAGHRALRARLRRRRAVQLAATLGVVRPRLAPGGRHAAARCGDAVRRVRSLPAGDRCTVEPVSGWISTAPPRCSPRPPAARPRREPRARHGRERGRRRHHGGRHRAARRRRRRGRVRLAPPRATAPRSRPMLLGHHRRHRLHRPAEHGPPELRGRRRRLLVRHHRVVRGSPGHPPRPRRLRRHRPGPVRASFGPLVAAPPAQQAPPGYPQQAPGYPASRRAPRRSTRRSRRRARRRPPATIRPRRSSVPVASGPRRRCEDRPAPEAGRSSAVQSLRFPDEPRNGKVLRGCVATRQQPGRSAGRRTDQQRDAQ